MDRERVRDLAADAARRLLDQVGPVPAGTAAVVVTVDVGGVRCRVRVAAAARPRPGGRRRAPGGSRAQCRADVLAAVAAAGRPLTRKDVGRALRAAGRDYGASTLDKALADLTRAAELVNPQDKRGYRLPGPPPAARQPALFDPGPPAPQLSDTFPAASSPLHRPPPAA